MMNSSRQLMGIVSKDAFAMSGQDEHTQKAQKITRFMGVASIGLSLFTVALVLYVFLTQ